MNPRVVAYPPGGRLLLPAADRRAAAAGATILMACRPAVVAAHHLAWAALACAGPRILPGQRRRLHDDRWESLSVAVHRALGRFDAVALVERRQAARPARLALVVRDGRPLAFVKAVPSERAAPLQAERRALEALARAGPGPVTVPELLAIGDADGWDWLALAPLPARPHRPARGRAPVGRIAEWLAEALAPAVDRSVDAPGHWQAMHGDFAPWNLRRYLGGPLALVDFEEVRLGPPGADLTYWAAARVTLGRRSRSLRDTDGVSAEARAYWRGVVRRRLELGLDPTLDRRLLAVLAA